MSGFFGGSSGGGSTIYTEDDLATIQASTPAVGDLGFPTDSNYHLICRADGVWSYRVPGINKDLVPPVNTGWTAFNSGSVTGDNNAARQLFVPADGTAPLKGEYRARPSDPTTTPYWFEAIFHVSQPGTNGGVAVGLGFTDGTGVAINAITDWEGALGKPGLFVARWTNATTFSATDANVAFTPGQYLYLYCEEDASERHFYWGELEYGNISEIGSGFARTTTITATSIGWWASNNDADVSRYVHLIHWDSGEL